MREDGGYSWLTPLGSHEATTMEQPTDQQLNYQVAEQLFGWKWIATEGIPTRSTPGYPNKCRVRQFFSPQQLSQWNLEHDGCEATGNEPLSYRYSSSQGPEMVPNYLDADDYLVLKKARKLWRRGSVEWKAFVAHLPAAEKYHLGDYSRAALIVLEDVAPA